MSDSRFSPVLLPKSETARSKLKSRRNAVILTGFITAVLYSAFATASWGTCPGGITDDGGYLDSAGESTTVVSQCISAVLHPNAAVYLVIALVIVAGIWLARRHPDDAVRTLGITATVVVAIGLLAVAVGWFLFFQFQPANWEPGDLVSFPPFLNVDLKILPMR